MTRLFLKTFYGFVLWILLIANLLFVFNINTIPFVSVARSNYDGYYFGISTLIESFQDLSTSGYFNTLTGMSNTINTWKNTAMDLLTGDNTLIGGFDFPEINNPWDVLVSIGIAVSSIGKIIASFAVFLGVITLFILYVVFFIFQITWFFFALLSGYYVSPLPIVPTPTFI